MAARVVVVAGFQSTSLPQCRHPGDHHPGAGGDRHLGRGPRAAAMGRRPARSYTDVAGVLSTDPRQVPGPS